MILPDKHISFAESLIGLGSFILNNLTAPKTIDTLWYEFKKAQGMEYPAFHSFDNLVLSVNLLYALRMIEMSNDDYLQRARYNAPN